MNTREGRWKRDEAMGGVGVRRRVVARAYTRVLTAPFEGENTSTARARYY